MKNGQNNFPIDNDSTSETHAQKADQNYNLLFQNKQEDLRNLPSQCDSVA